jgi:nitroimidazol reductase NimA-like FMN-containing flavoprotein (pyridoxamine 5'-phosphate oxidase superfamily)
VLRVEDMPPAEMYALLQTANFGHLGYSHNGRRYVVPMHYAYNGKELYFFTTEWMKTQFMNGNPQVCLQVDEVTDNSHWRSVMVIGSAERLTDDNEMERAMQQITARNPSLTPIRATELDAFGRAFEIALYRIQPEIIDGRKTM